MNQRKKKPTQAQRVQAEKAALELRLLDILAGVAGHHIGSFQEIVSDEGSPIASVFGVEEWLRFVAAVQSRFPSVEGYAGVYSPHNIHHLDRIETAVEWLYSQGIRA